jgi:2-oxoglutarate ferredoxin oxidoreductase subunit alpha
MCEYTGLAYFAEIPVVIWDVQRVGPSTGMPTRTAQADLTEIYFFSHGDTKHVILLPGTVNECFEFGWKAFDLAERMQTPVFVLSDLDLGMNSWMSEPFKYPDQPMDRGKVLWEEDIERLKGEWGRYVDVDGDGIPYRTLPGNRHPHSAWFGRGTGHDEKGAYTEAPEVWERVLDRIGRKYETARKYVPEPVIDTLPGAEIGLIAYGSSEQAVSEARTILRNEGMKTDSLRLRAIPFTAQVADFIHKHRVNYVIEMNRDGQMQQILSLNHPVDAAKLVSVAHIDGLPLTANWIVEQVRTLEEK